MNECFRNELIKLHIHSLNVYYILMSKSVVLIILLSLLSYKNNIELSILEDTCSSSAELFSN